ncbi:MAG: hypothetical protein ACI4SZ_06510 [Lachnospiraceae bacterium]
MLESTEKLFCDMPDMMKKLKKAAYEKNMKQFRKDNADFFEELLQYMEQSSDKEAAAHEIAKVFVQRVRESFSVKGKIGSRTGADLDFFMIYYVFPAILLTESPFAEQTAQAIRGEWNREFCKNISYTTYDKLYQSFRDKIFGIF